MKKHYPRTASTAGGAAKTFLRGPSMDIVPLFRCSVCGKEKPASLFPGVNPTVCYGRCTICNRLHAERAKSLFRPVAKSELRIELKIVPKPVYVRKPMSPEKSKENVRRWKERNPAGYAAYLKSASHRRRARKKSAEGSFTAHEWLELCKKYGGKCVACGQVRKLAADHVVPLARGGNNYITNIQPLCKSCNSRKGAKTIDYRT